MKSAVLKFTLALAVLMAITLSACSTPGSAVTTSATTTIAPPAASTIAAPPTPATAPAPAGYANPGLLVSTRWLNQHFGDTSMIIIDSRKAADYDAGHIQNAINIVPSLFDGPSPTVPTDKSNLIAVTDIAAKLGQLGVSENMRVIIYGANVDANAGRLFWMLEYLGHKDVRIVDGGIDKYKKDNYAGITTEKSTRDARSFAPAVDETKLATRSYVVDNHPKAGFAIVDARNTPDFAAKHVPHAVNILMGDYLNADGTVKSAADLRTLLDSEGITSGKTVITYCPTGYRAAQAYIIFRLMGYDVADYDGSWAEWSADPSLPTEP